MRLVQLLVLALSLAGVPSSSFAQCSMCRTTLTQSEQGREMAVGLNRGILFLLAVPLLVVASGVVALKLHERRVKELNSDAAGDEYRKTSFSGSR